MEDVLQTPRRRMRHHSSMLNDIERALDSFRDQLNTAEDDVDMWRRSSGYKPKFSTQETWLLLWPKGIWFSQATPKFAFMAWLATRGRLSTMDRVSQWSQGIDTSCVLCKNTPESRNHLFFECSFSAQVWEHLVKGILQNSYTEKWTGIKILLLDRNLERYKLLCTRYAFQAAVYAIWRERNRRRHGEPPLPTQALMKLVDKGMRNKLSLMQLHGWKRFEGILQFWFATRV